MTSKPRLFDIKTDGARIWSGRTLYAPYGLLGRCRRTTALRLGYTRHFPDRELGILLHGVSEPAYDFDRNDPPPDDL